MTGAPRVHLLDDQGRRDRAQADVRDGPLDRVVPVAMHPRLHVAAPLVLGLVQLLDDLADGEHHEPHVVDACRRRPRAACVHATHAADGRWWPWSDRSGSRPRSGGCRCSCRRRPAGRGRRTGGPRSCWRPRHGWPPAIGRSPSRTSGSRARHRRDRAGCRPGWRAWWQVAGRATNGGPSHRRAADAPRSAHGRHASPPPARGVRRRRTARRGGPHRPTRPGRGAERRAGAPARCSTNHRR